MLDVLSTTFLCLDKLSFGRMGLEIVFTNVAHFG
jgi:hypothetical protein